MLVSRELIGAVALTFFWIHIVLIAGSAWLDARALGRLGRGRVRAGIVRAGRGPGGVLACNSVEQVGRSKGDGVVHFSDAAHRSELFGGVVELDDGSELELEPAAAIDVAVWPEAQRRIDVAAPKSADIVAAAASEARRARGYARSVSVTIGEGERVFLLEPPTTHDEECTTKLIVAAVDPRRWLARKRWLIAGFVVAELALASACTVAILWPPLFDWLSMLGAASALGLFLGVQPLGVAVQDAVRTPDRAYLRGRWG